MKLTPSLLESHEHIHSNQIEKLNRMDRLMFDCWREGLKRKDILPLAQEIESGTSEADVGVYFRRMFRRELSNDAKYLSRK
ncbi:hypothetical protein [Vibrio crassostreae]|uniref:hypothetical protein n=1 Tax=Vibrio crassostreae TaxID=246167 RepID=UPI001B3081B4|nr:hypothetical protein [Vibrio crassostreae]